MRIPASLRTWNVPGVLLFAAIVAAIFWEILPRSMAFLAPDAMPFFPFGYRTAKWDEILAGGGEVTPHFLYWQLFAPLLANKMTYIIDTLMLVLAGVYYLRGCGASRTSAWLGGIALGFSGYSFTLFSAGHRGYFHMMGCAVFAFGLLTRCFRERHWFHFAMLGTVFAWSVLYQADVLAMLALLVGAYALWLTFASASDPASRPWQRVRSVYPRFLLSIAVALVIAWPGLKSVIGYQMAGRKETIAATLAGSSGGAASNAEKKKAQYIFATNWSLPPEDMAEFIAPCLYGVDSYDSAFPYWGALGRPFGWVPGQRMAPNYRQHTVYLGAVQGCFALLALLAWWYCRRRGRPDAASAPAADARLLADVPFWGVAGAICLLLALGRYTPVYHAFYAIPYMDLVRCPVKFHHLVEICTALLFGLGVEVWLRLRQAALPVGGGRQGRDVPGRPPFDRALRAATIAGAIAAGLALLAAGVAEASKAGVADWIVQVGPGRQFAGPLAEYLVSNLVRAAFLFVVAAVLLWLGWSRAVRMPARLLVAALALTVTIDLTLVARRYVRPINLAPFYGQNLVVKTILARNGGPGAGVANYLTSNQSERDWFSSALLRNGMRLSVPDIDDRASAAAKAAAALGLQPDRALGPRAEAFWRTTQTRFVLSAWSALEPLVKAGILTPVLTFAAEPRSGTLREAQPAANTFLLAECVRRLPSAYVVDAWQGGLDVTNQLAALARADWNPGRQTVTDAPDAAVPTSGEAHAGGEARVLSRRGWDFRFQTHVQADAPRAGLLVVDEPYAGDLDARLDGRPVPVRRVNALWCGVEVPAGRHAVTIQRHWQPLWPCLSGVTGLLMAAWGMARLLRRRPDEGEPSVAPL